MPRVLALASAILLIHSPLVLALDCDDRALWQTDEIYTGGAEVRHLGVGYTANYWTRGNDPQHHAANPWDHWRRDGQCEDGGSPGNRAPVAQPNGPYSGSAGDAIQFSSAGSYDPDGDITGYRWRFGDGAESADSNPVHIYQTSGSFQVELSVTDSEGLSHSSTTSASLSDAGSGCQGLPRYLEGTSYVAGEHVVNVRVLDGQLVEYACVIAGWCSSGAGWAYEPGNGSAWEQAWDEIGECRDDSGNLPPHAAANGPYDAEVGVLVQFSSAGSVDVDGHITAYRWRFGDGGESIEANPQYRYNAAGNYSVTLTVTDAAGASASQTTTATVRDGDEGRTPVAINGRLSVCGKKLCNQYGRAIQLRGMSTHGVQWYGWGDCINERSLDVLAEEWGADILRISLYVQEGGYETNPDFFTEQVSRIIDEVSERGMYALVDWHQLNPGDPNDNLSHAVNFFSAIATTHKDKNNIIYDIANEPNGVSWTRIKEYADQIIPVIRSIDSDAPIFVGTHGWATFGLSDGRSAQDVVSDPLHFDNIMYTFHFYAASHGNPWLSELDWASDRLPVFVTEFGMQNYAGEDANDFVMAQRYLDLMQRKKIGWTNWNFSDDWRSGAVWKQNTCPGGPWTDSQLKESGRWIKSRLLNPSDDFPRG